MQRRLLRSFVGIAAVMVLALGIPLGIVASRLVADQTRERLQREADAVQIALDAASTGAPVPDAVRPFIAPASRVEVEISDGRRLVLNDAEVGDDPISVRVASPDGTVVIVQSDGGPVHARVVRVWLVVAVVAAAALAVAALVAVSLARRLARPLQHLAESAQRLGDGGVPTEIPGGIAEVDAVAEQLRSSGERLGRALERERAFSVNASHQLRTAVTALRLRLEEFDLAVGPEDRAAELEAVLRQTDRLETTIEELLEFARHSGEQVRSTVRLDEIVRERAASWAPVVERAGRRFEVAPSDDIRAEGTPGAVSQVLDILVDNALRHGRGTIRVTANRRPTPGLRVSDEGAGILPGAETRIFERGVTGAQGTGIGLALARELVESLGGRLVLSQTSPPVFDVYLERPSPTPSPSP